MYPPKSEIFLTLPYFKIYYYGLIMALAIFIGFMVIKLISKLHYNNISQSILSDLFPIVTLFGLLGGRLYYVLMDFDYYSTNISEIFAIWHGGLSIHGAIIGGFIAGTVYLKIKKQSILPYADVFSYGLLIGQAIGRWGNFFNSEAYGLPCNLPWKLYVPLSHRIPEYQNYSYFHPTFLYESIWNIFCFIILYFFIRKNIENKYGETFFYYLIFYSIGRIFIENLRIDSVLNVFTVPIAILMSFLLIIFSICALIILNHKYKNFEVTK